MVKLSGAGFVLHSFVHRGSMMIMCGGSPLIWLFEHLFFVFDQLVKVGEIHRRGVDM